MAGLQPNGQPYPEGGMNGGMMRGNQPQQPTRRGGMKNQQNRRGMMPPQGGRNPDGFEPPPGGRVGRRR
jgi:hypothetical protein